MFSIAVSAEIPHINFQKIHNFFMKTFAKDDINN